MTWVATVVASLVGPAIGCKALDRTVTPSAPAPRQRGIDEPPPLHTGGLGVLSVSPSGQQGPGSSPASHGDPVFEAISTALGAAVIGTAAARTAAACAAPDASAECLRGPGPADNERDAGR